MALINEAMEDFTILEKTTTGDGLGGVVTSYTEGAKIKAALSFESSPEQKIANALGANSSYTAITSKAVYLRYDDIIRREATGQTYRVTSKGQDRKTPASARLYIRAVQVEEMEIGQ